MKNYTGNSIFQQLTCLALTVAGLLLMSGLGFAFDEVSDSGASTKADAVNVTTVPLAIQKATVLIRPAGSKSPRFEPGILLQGSEPDRTIVLCRGDLESVGGGEFQVDLADPDKGIEFKQRWVDAVCLYGGSEKSLFSLLSVGGHEAAERATSVSSELPDVDQELLIYGLQDGEGFAQKLKTETVNVVRWQQPRNGSPWHDCICKKSPSFDVTQIVAVFDTDGRFFGTQGAMAEAYRNPDVTEERTAFTSAVDIAEILRDNGVAVPESLLAATLQRRIERAHSFRPISSKNVTISWSDERDELQGQSGKTGKWSMLKIPRQDFIIPIVSDNVAAVMVGESLAAYSAECGRWDLLEVAGIDKNGFALEDNAVKTFVGEERRFYVFSSKSGEWSSPTDPDYRPAEEVLQVSTEIARRCMDVFKDSKASLMFTNGTMRIRGTKRRVDEVVNKIRGFEAAEVARRSGHAERAGAGLSAFSTDPSLAEQQSLELAQTLRTEKVSAEQQARLKSLVAKSLDDRLNQQRKLAQQLEARFKSIQAALQAREDNRDRIIDRRVEELLDPNVEWQTLTKRPQAAHPMPTTGTPIGLTGPPHFPRSTQAGLRKANKAEPSSRIAMPDIAGMESTAEIVNELATRRRLVELVADTLNGHLAKFKKYSQPLETLRADGFEGDESQRQAGLSSARSSIHHDQKNLPHMMSTWKNAWRAYRAHVANRRLNLEEKTTNLALAELQWEQLKQQQQKNAATNVEVKQAELQLKLAAIEVERAKEDLAVFEAIAEDSPHLDPNNFDTSKLLADPETKR